MNQQQRKDQGYICKPKSKERTFSISKDCQEEEDDENEYMTNQEKLWNAIEMNLDYKVISAILQKQDVEVDAKNIFDDGWTALHYAVQEGQIEIVKLLVDLFHASIDPLTTSNKTPFHLACIRGEQNLIVYLLDHDANPLVVDRDGSTPLHYLCETQNHEMIKLVMPKCGASKHLRNRFGKKPLDYITDKEVKRTLMTTKSGSRRSSQSKKMEEMRRQSDMVQIVKLKDDKEVKDGMQQMFRNFSLYKRQTIQQSKRNTECRQKIDNNKGRVSVNNTSQGIRSVLSPKNASLNSSKDIQQKYSSRLTLGNYKNVPKTQPSTQPSSTKNFSKHAPQPKNMFSPSNQTLLHKNQSPKAGLNHSQSQNQLQQKTKNVNSTRIDSQRLTSIKSVANLLQQKQSQLCEQGNKIEEEDDDDYNLLSVTRKVKNPQVMSQNHSSNQFSDCKQEDKYAESSEKTDESSQFIIDHNNHSVVNKNHKLTTFSLNQLSDVGANQENNNADEKSNQPEKIGPWSFIAHQLLGTGSFGEVFLVEKISNGKYYAMKVLNKSKIMGNNLTRYAMTERNVMSIVKHPFIVSLNYAFQTSEKLFLILDYCPGGDLAEYLQLEKRFNEDKVRLYSSEILLALEELHRKDIIFRDLKPDNVVLDAEGHAMITDFGLSKEGVMKEGMAKSFCGSYAYLAPEMLKKLGHGKAVDWYLLGVIIYEMLTGVPPYYANNKEELFENIKNAHLHMPSYLSLNARDIILRLLNRNPKKRLGTFGGASEIKKHPFFKNIEWTKLYNRVYKAPEPYLKKRFEKFLSMSPELQTNSEVNDQLRKQALFKGPINEDQHVPGWSFVSPIKQYE